MELPTPQDLRTRREELDLTQSRLAEMAGVSQPLIARIEGGDVDPRLSTLRRIVEALEEAAGGVVRAQDLMHTTVISVSPADSVHEAVELMQEEGYSQLPVIQEGVPVGSISYTDVSDAGESVGDRPVGEVMSASFPTREPTAKIDEIRRLLEYYKAVMITDGGSTVGIITEADVAAFFS
jgi:predicted transcriptional regulator